MARKIKLPQEVFYVYLDSNGTEDYKIYTQEFGLSQIHWRALDNKKQRCDDKRTSKDETVSTTECIVQYLENEIGCTMALQGSKVDIKR